MRVTIIYKIPNEQGQVGEPLEDVLNWPDVRDVEAVRPHAIAYLDHKYGGGGYLLLDIEEQA